MSALGDRLRAEADNIRWIARLADEHEATTLADSAQGRGPHAAAALRWAASRAEAPAAFGVGVVGLLRQWADEAER